MAIALLLQLCEVGMKLCQVWSLQVARWTAARCWVGNKHGAGSSSWADVSPGVDGPAPGPSCWRVSQPLSTPAAQNFQKLSHLSLVLAAPTANGLPTLIEGRYRAIQLRAQLRAVQCL